MTRFSLHLDSRNRLSPSTIHGARFALHTSVSNVKTISVRNVQTPNVIANVRSGWNDILWGSDGGADWGMNFDTGFYTASTIVARLQAEITAMKGAGTYVVLDVENNRLTWTLPANFTVDSRSSAGKMLGLPNSGVLAGTFTSTLFLAPMNIAFCCPQLTDRRSLSGSAEPFFTAPINSGYLEMNFWEALHKERLEYGSSGIVLSTLDFEILDPASGQQLSEMSHWSMEIEIECV